jgi:hypothetical protein
MNTRIVLSEDVEQRVIDLAAEYSERLVSGGAPSLKEYLDRLPNEASRTVFRQAANMTKFVSKANAQRTSSMHRIARGSLQIPEHI